jgi:hypothetical protein
MRAEDAETAIAGLKDDARVRTHGPAGGRAGGRGGVRMRGQHQLRRDEDRGEYGASGAVTAMDGR